MLRIFLALWLAITPAFAWAGMMLTGVGPAPTVAGGCSDTNATAWAAAVVSAGGTVSGGQQTNVCNLIVALKGHSLFAKLDRMWLLASENTQQAKIDIVNLANLGTITGSPTFTASQGYTGNAGAGAFIISGFIPSSSGVNYTLNSASIGIYDRSNRTSGENSTGIGGVDASSFSVGIQPFSFSFNIMDINTTSNALLVSSPTTAQGFWVATRTTSNARAFYRNGNTTPIGSDTAPSTTLSTVAVGFLGRNNNGTPDQFTNDQEAIVFMGGALTSTDIANLSADVNGLYMTALGTNVY